MDFRRIEYILIVAFFWLNLFLGYVFISNNAMLFASPDGQTAINIAREMQADDINYEKPSSENQQLPLVRTRRHTLLDDHMAELDAGFQVVSMGNTQRLLSRFVEPVALPKLTAEVEPEDVSAEMLAPIQKLLNDGTILEGAAYQYYMYYPQQQSIRYVQTTAAGLPIVDDSSEIIFFLDAEYDIISYEQTFAGAAEAQGEQRTLISEKQAMENLYLNNQLPNGSSIIKSELAYYTILPLTDMTMYSPVWTFGIKTEEGNVLTLNVDAINGSMIQTGGARPSGQ